MSKLKTKIFFINGAPYKYSSNFTINSLISYLGFNKKTIVVDYNGFIIEKELWNKTEICTDDCIEVLSIAGGG